MGEILRRETRVSGVEIEDDKVTDKTSETSSLVLKPTLESIWSLPQDPLRARDRNQGLGRVEAAAYNPDNGEVLVACDRELVLWKVDFESSKGHPTQRLKSVPIQVGSLEQDGHHDGAVVRQIIWVKWLHQGSFFVLTVPHELHIYRSGLELVGVHQLHERHILCLSLHNERQEFCISCADGTMKRFNITSTLRWEGLGLGYRHSVLQDNFEVLKTWHAGEVEQDTSSHKPLARTRSPARESSPRRSEEIDKFWVASLFTDEERDRLFGCCGLDVHVWRWASGDLLSVLKGLHNQPITSCWLSPVPPQPLVTCSRDGSLRVWKYSGDEARLMETLEGHERGVFGMSYDESSGCLFSFGDDGVVMCWNLQRMTFVHSHALYKPAPSFLAMALHGDDGHHKSLFVEARYSGNVASGTIQVVSLPKQRSGNSSFDDDRSLRGDKRSGTGLLVIMGTEVDVVEVQTDRLFLTACLAPVKSVTIAHPACPRPKLPYREVTTSAESKEREAQLGRIRTGNLGIALCGDGTVQLFGCSAGEVSAVLVPSLRRMPVFAAAKVLSSCLFMLFGMVTLASFQGGRRQRKRWRHTKGSAGWELTDVSQHEMRRRRLSEVSSEIGGAVSVSAGSQVAGAAAGGKDPNWGGDASNADHDNQDWNPWAMPDVSARRKMNKGEQAGGDLGCAMVCEFHSQAGVLLLAWANGTVRVIDISDGRVIDEIKEDKRSMRGGVKVTGACLVTSVETEEPPAKSRSSSVNSNRSDFSPFGARQREGEGETLWAKYRVARVRNDGVLEVSEPLTMDGDCAGGDAEAGPGGRQMVAHVKSGECAVTVVQWLSRTQLLRIFKGRLDQASVEHAKAGAVLCGGQDGVFWLWGFKMVANRARDGLLDLGPGQRKEEVDWVLLARVPTVRDAVELGGLTAATVSDLHQGCVVCGFGSGSVQVWRMGVVRGDRFSLSVVNAKEEARLRAPNAFDSKKGAILVMDYHMHAIMHCVCSPDGLVVLTLSDDKGVAEWNMRDGALLQTIPNQPAISSAGYTKIPRNRGTNVLLRRTSIVAQAGDKAGGADTVVGGDEMVIVVGIGSEVNVLPSMYKEVQGEFAFRWRDRVLSRKGTSNMLLGGKSSGTLLGSLHSKHAVARGQNRRNSLMLALQDQGSFEQLIDEEAKEEDIVASTFAYLDRKEAKRVATMNARAVTIQCWWRVLRARWRFRLVMVEARERRRAQQLQGEAGREEGVRIAEERRLEAEKMAMLTTCSVFALLGVDELRSLVPDVTKLCVEKDVVLMERERDKEKADWRFGGGVFVLAAGEVTERVEVSGGGQKKSVVVRTVGVGELLGETSMWGGGEACGEEEHVTTSAESTLLRIPALVLKRRLNPQAAAEWEGVVRQYEEQRRSKVAEAMRSSDVRGGGSLRRRSSVASMSDATGVLSRAASVVGALKRRGSMAGRGSVVSVDAGGGKEGERGRKAGTLERTGTIQLMRFGVSIGLQRLPESWECPKNVWPERSADGMSKEERDIVTDLQISSVTAKKEGLGLARSVRDSLTSLRHEVYLDTVRANKAKEAADADHDASGDSSARTVLRPASAMSVQFRQRPASSHSEAHTEGVAIHELSSPVASPTRSTYATSAPSATISAYATRRASAEGLVGPSPVTLEVEPTATMVASQFAKSRVKTAPVHVPSSSPVGTHGRSIQHTAPEREGKLAVRSEEAAQRSRSSRPISPVFRRGLSPSMLKSTARSLAANALRLPENASFSTIGSGGATRSDMLLKRGLTFAIDDDDDDDGKSEVGAGGAVVHHDHDAKDAQSAAAETSPTSSPKQQPQPPTKVPFGLRASDIGPGYLNITQQELSALKPWKHFRRDPAGPRPASTVPRRPTSKPKATVPKRPKSHAGQSPLQSEPEEECSPWRSAAMARADTVIGIGIQEFAARAPALDRPTSALSKVYSDRDHDEGDSCSEAASWPSLEATEAAIAGRTADTKRGKSRGGRATLGGKRQRGLARSQTWSERGGGRRGGGGAGDMISFLTEEIPIPLS